MKHDVLRSPRQRSGGWAILVVLIVFVIIAITMFKGPLQQDPVTQVTQAQTQIDRSQGVVCVTNRNAFSTHLMAKQAMGDQVTIEQMRQMAGQFRCPDGGGLLLGPDGQLLCTLHDDLTAEVIQQSTVLIEPAPDPYTAQ